jgi:Tfp pilus assembly protein PilF
MMRAIRITAVLVCVAALGTATAAQNRGKAKAEGKVVGDQGQPLQDVIVAAVMDGFDKPFQQAKTNNKGEWKIENLAAGKWKFFFGGKEGLEEKNVEAQVGDGGTTAVALVTLGKPVDAAAAVNAELQRAQEMMQTKQVAEARKVFEGILEKYPQMQAEFRGQLHGAIAQTYGLENQPAQALEHLKKGIDLDPNNVDLQLVYGEALVIAGQRAEGEKIILAADITKVKDPFPYMNIVISRINDQKVEEAMTLLGKLMAQFPNDTSLYYYRGRANLAAKKLPEAKADLEKFAAAAAPDARELPDAKKILEQLKDIK